MKKIAAVLFVLVFVLCSCKSDLPAGGIESFDDYNRELSEEEIAAAMKELGWTPTTMFKDGIVLTIDWYMSEEGRKWTEECTSGEYRNWIEKNYKERK